MGSRQTRADADRRRTAFHEAGHAVASVIYGPGIERAVLTPRNPHYGGFTVHQRPDFAELHPHITAAGPMAEARHRFGQRPTMRQWWAVLDKNTSDYKALTAAGGTPSPSDIAPLLDRVWPAVERLAEVLNERGEIGEGDVLRALRVPPGAEGGRYINELRSGYRAVPREG